jgi:hypothetical protein
MKAITPLNHVRECFSLQFTIIGQFSYTFLPTLARNVKVGYGMWHSLLIKTGDSQSRDKINASDVPWNVSQRIPVIDSWFLLLAVRLLPMSFARTTHGKPSQRSLPLKNIQSLPPGKIRRDEQLKSI